jgi:hypothetical protein
MANNGLTHISKILKELELITKELKQHNDRMDEKYGRLDVLPTSDSTTGNARICCGKCKGECE